MIQQVSGDILLSKAQVIAHGVAPKDPMNQGLALSLHQKFPAMHKDFHHWCAQHNGQPGEAWMWGSTNGVRIVNLLTQEGSNGHAAHPGRATIKHVRDSLRVLAKMVKKEAFTSIALPRLATGVGGLEWRDVLPVIEEQLGELGIPVVVYSEFHAGQQAKEVLG
ncbi:MAG: macro domain-containing protein [Steroidobacteraceae bacterium]